jgi:hypothetical protein
VRWHEDDDYNKVCSIGFCALLLHANIAALEIGWTLRAIELKFRPVYDAWKSSAAECESYIMEIFEETNTGPFDMVFRESMFN